MSPACAPQQAAPLASPPVGSVTASLLLLSGAPQNPHILNDT